MLALISGSIESVDTVLFYLGLQERLSKGIIS